MRSRNLKPVFFTAEVFDKLPAPVMLVYLGLHCMADREGKLIGGAWAIKQRLTTLAKYDVNQALEVLVNAGLVEVFTVIDPADDGMTPALRILHFGDTQTPLAQEKASGIPNNPGPQSEKIALRELGALLAPVGNVERASSWSIFCLPRTRVLPGKSKSKSKSKSQSTPPKPPTLADDFETFWKLYPRKVGKQDAIKAFEKLAPSPELLRVMLAKLGRQAVSHDWRKDAGRFIPHPATWLTGKRWEDELEHSAPPPVSLADKAREAMRQQSAGSNGIGKDH